VRFFAFWLKGNNMKKVTPKHPIPVYADAGFFRVRALDNVREFGLMRFAFTVGLCIDIEPTSQYQIYTGRYCYPSLNEALAAFDEYTGTGDPSGDWVKYKGLDGERENPNLKEN
jgi:hypothetical protein